MRSKPAPELVVPWAMRALWVGVLVAGGSAVDVALADASAGASSTVTWAGFALWVFGVATMAVPATATLTAMRVTVPLAIPLAVLTWVGGAGADRGALFVGVSVLATVTAMSSTVGTMFVQASAYGDEERHVLRPPLPYLIVAVVVWLAWATAAGATAAAVAHGRWWLAAVTASTTVAGGALASTRWHRLSRRWLVLVPVGLVVHDHLVLAETLMLRRQQLASLGLAVANTDALDLTGPASGHAVEIRTSESVTALRSTPPWSDASPAVHLTGCLVAPTRPGRFLAAAARRRLPVGG